METKEVQPAASVVVTPYVPPVVTVMAAVVSPVLHKRFVGMEEVRVSDDPTQKVLKPVLVVITGAEGNGLTVTETGADELEHPLTSTKATE